MEGLSALGTQFTGLKKNSLLLCPKASNDEIHLNQSKLGGRGLLDDIAPNCPICNTSTTFVLQLFKTEFTSLFFPRDHNLLTIYRCRNSNCIGLYNDYMDKFTVIQYHQPKDQVGFVAGNNYHAENKFPICKFQPVSIQDLPG